MFRKWLKEKRAKVQSLETEPDFRYRGKESSRVENLSDAVFAFAITLLVVSLEVPSSFDEMLGRFADLPAFAICILMLFGIWYEHYIFFLRYGLKDGRTISINALLLFLVLFYIYPLKFLFSFFVNAFYGVLSGNSHQLEVLFTQTILPEQIPELMILYGLGAAGVYFLFAMLYKNAWDRKEVMELTDSEKLYTRLSIYQNLLMAFPPLLSAVLAMVFFNDKALASKLSGAAYGLYGLMWIFKLQENKLKNKASTVTSTT